MAEKIPVGGTIARAYGFAFGNIVNNLGMIWIPVVILWAAAYFLQAPYLKAAMNGVGAGPGAALAAFPMLMAFFAINVVAQSAQIALLSKEALGLRSGSAFLQFPFGAATWRVLGAFLLYFIVMIVIYIGLALGSVLIVGLLAALMAKGSVGAAWIAAAIFLGVLCALLYIGTRLSFFLAPVAVAEGKVSLIRAWQLTRGNFWRIFFILLVLFVPFLILELIFLAKVLGPFFQSLHANMTPQELAAWQQRFVHGTTGFSQRWWFITYPVGVLVALLLYGMYVGANSYAYRALTHRDNSQEAF